MKRRRGFAQIELPLVLFAFGLLLFAVAVRMRGSSPTLAFILLAVGIVFCLPLLILLFL